MSTLPRLPRRAGTALREVLLTAAAVAGVVCLLVALAGAAFDVRPLIFRSGSMGPQIPTGALGLVRHVPADELARGDIVSVIDPAGTRITHRVVDTDRDGASVALTLQGDANPVPDAAPYVVEGADRVFFHVDGLGYVVAWLSSPVAIFAGGLLVGVLLTVAFGPRRDSPRTAATPSAPAAPTSRRSSGPAGLALMVAVACAGTALTASHVGTTSAAFTDTAEARSGAFSATSITAGAATCASTGTSINLSWPHTRSGVDYKVTADGLPESEFRTDVTHPGHVGGTVVHHVPPAPLQTLGGRNVTLRVTTYLTAAPSWSASTTVGAHVSLLGLALRCGSS